MKDYFTFRTIIEMQLKFEPGKLDLSVDFLKGFGFWNFLNNLDVFGDF